MAQRFDVGDRVFVVLRSLGSVTGAVVGTRRSRWFAMTAYVVHLDEPWFGRPDIAVFPGRLVKIA
ncbi:MAG: hypothetical protein ACR2LQ_04540 [Acidimicrobiales bacterium]